jgi:hypothetical protein
MILGLSLSSAVADGADWTPLTKGRSEDVEVFVDRERVEHISDTVNRAWIKYRYSVPKQFDSKRITELAVYSEYNCNEGKYKILQTIEYFTDGTSETDSSERQGYILHDDIPYAYLCKEIGNLRQK